MPVTFSSYRLGPGQRVSNKTVPPPWDWLLRRENELGPRRSKSRIIFAVLVPPLYVAVQAPALIVTLHHFFEKVSFTKGPTLFKCEILSQTKALSRSKDIFWHCEILPGISNEQPFSILKRFVFTFFTR